MKIINSYNRNNTVLKQFKLQQLQKQVSDIKDKITQQACNIALSKKDKFTIDMLEIEIFKAKSSPSNYILNTLSNC